MAILNRADRGFRSTQPYDSTDPPRFSQLVETAKDAFAYELSQFFDYTTSDASYKLSETPNIQKFAINPSGSSTSSLETAVTLIMANADKVNKFPMVSITSSSIKEKKMGLGSNFATTVIYAPRIVGRNVGPFNLQSSTGTDYTITLTTYPSGDMTTSVSSIITFSSLMFPNLISVTCEQLVRVINRSMGLYYTLSETSTGCLSIEAGGVAGKSYPNSVTITAGDPEALAALGFVVGDTDSSYGLNAKPSHRYVVAGDMTVNIDIITDSINTRTELADLVYNFFAFFLEKRRFEFFGRSYFDRDQTPDEWFHIVLKNQFTWSAEVAKARQGGEQYDMIYAMRGSVPIFIEDFIDRQVVEEPIFAEQSDIAFSETLPIGDYFQPNYN